jgi:hypothetical protein
MIDNEHVAVSIRNYSFRAIKSSISIHPVVCRTDRSHCGKTGDRADDPIVPDGRDFSNGIVGGIANEEVALIVGSNSGGKIELGGGVWTIICSGGGAARQGGKSKILPTKLATHQQQEKASCVSCGEMHRLYTELLGRKLQPKRGNRAHF